MADQYRADLKDSSIGNGRHGFIAPTPDAAKDGRPHHVSARLIGCDVQVNASPKAYP